MAKTDAIDPSTIEREARRVRFALIDYLDHDPRTGTMATQYAFRDQVVDIPVDEIPRLETLGAVVDPSFELVRAGEMQSLPEAVGDEELKRWIADASPSEVSRLAQERPNLAVRIDAMRYRLFHASVEQDSVLERAAAAARGEELPDAYVPDLEDSDIVFRVPPKVDERDAVAKAQGLDPAEVVRGTAAEVAAYVADHPDQADDILDAESEARQGRPRNDVVRAVEVAKAHTAGGR